LAYQLLTLQQKHLSECNFVKVPRTKITPSHNSKASSKTRLVVPGKSVPCLLRQVGKYEVKEYNMSTSAAPFNLQAPQTNAHQATEVGGMDRAEFNTLDPMAKLLVMLASMGRKGLLTAEQKSHLKYKILNEQSPILYNALEAYERDNTEAELADTFARVLAFEKGERLNDQFVPAHPVPLAHVQRNLTTQFGGADSFHGFGKTEPAPPKTSSLCSSADSRNYLDTHRSLVASIVGARILQAVLQET
jgi:hypothetical protein